MQHNSEVSGGLSDQARKDTGMLFADEAAERCRECGNPNLQQSGVCKVCPVCGTSTGCN